MVMVMETILWVNMSFSILQVQVSDFYVLFTETLSYYVKCLLEVKHQLHTKMKDQNQ